MTINDSEFQLIKKRLYELTGNVLSDNRKTMAQNKISKLLFSINGDYDVKGFLELVETGFYTQDFINAFTTNKTEFFRESFHFDDLTARVFPTHFKNNNSISIYSSAGSTGEEPYSAAISFLNFKESQKNPLWQARILATDIDTQALKKASEGVYTHPKNSNIFPEWVQPQKYFQRRDVEEEKEYFLIKIKESVRELVEFKRLNLFSNEYGIPSESFDVVFCRNVLIYFKTEDQAKILKNLLRILKVGGALYLGHSESPLEIAPFLKRLGQNIFIKER